MAEEERQLIDLDLLEKLRSIFRSYQDNVHLVGGAVRDLFLGRPVHDLDFVIPGKAIKLTFLVADSLGCPAFILDQERGTGRLILVEKGITIDFSALQGDSLEEDLRLRDFTINAMALPSSDFHESNVIDPLGGLKDLNRKIIRPTSDKVITSDPLRAFRAVRFAVELDFSLSSEVEELIRANRLLLKAVSGERIRDELLRIIESPRPAAGFEYLGLLGLYPFFRVGLEPVVEVEGLSHPEHDGVFRTVNLFPNLQKMHSWLLGEGDLLGETFKLANDTLRSIDREIAQYFERKVDGGLNGWTILKLGALFASINHAFEFDSTRLNQSGKAVFTKEHDPVSDFVRSQLKVLRLSRAAQEHILAIVIGSHRPLLTTIDSLSSRRDIYRFYRNTYPAGVDLAWISIASALAEKLHITNPQFFSKTLSTFGTLLVSYFRDYDEIIKPVPLINGTELIEETRLEPGPEIGKLLDLIEEGQAAGDIKTKDEALALANRYLGRTLQR